ncbi:MULTISPECIES: 23S rRNA pseudouridine(2604) synthase RluF [Halobacteriovorax]|uniref:Pseudouridine synthase n=1 Tax=Halobacteriovorax vibrionivorans TaxID=2152716 RepID=A0ABY0IF93_9BACT|nr:MULTISPECIES: 23S rRNA pseudouridine(2604) synthase RluF [Halobacteriovorax]RZF21613.1 23S rRNA pseudouridine(2604) synthase RluF [Halobacteriovorax vibrionivorans]TGD49094.1 23S rRNA pseudouridine(2604) synthase RluF [Halobacteriovorax sp. Y22]
MENNNSMRINKYISQSGICSRREVDDLIEQQIVKINGKLAEIGDRVFEGDVVEVRGQVVKPKVAEKEIIIALNKPRGIVSTTESSEKDNIVDYVNHVERVFPIGRLDKDSQGLIFLTNNGDIVNKILRAGNNHEKEYVVTVDKPINDKFINGMAGGVPILGTMTKKCKVEQMSMMVFKITLVQGLNRQIRRMCEYFGYNVTKLDRIRIMNIGLDGLGVGDWRELNDQEIASLYKLIEGSSSEDHRIQKRSALKAQVKKKPQQQQQRRKKKSKYDKLFKELDKEFNLSGKTTKREEKRKQNAKGKHRRRK